VTKMIVYKILLGVELAILKDLGRFEGTPADLKEGFIHLSLANQLDRVVRKHYSDAGTVHLVAIAVEQLGEKVKWEKASNGELYPHLYGVLNLTEVISCAPLECGADGSVKIPDFAPSAKL